MAILEITQLSVSDQSMISDTIQKTAKAFKQRGGDQDFTIGTQVQDSNAIQITSESTAGQSQGKFLGTCTGSNFHVKLNRPVFGANGPATANVIEFVQVWFPASQVDSAFQKKIEDDIGRFDELFKKESKHDIGLAIGWGLEEHSHESIKDEAAKCFFLLRGWESMEWFQKSIQTNSFKEAIPILGAWGAPSKMLHIENKVRSGPQSHE